MKTVSVFHAKVLQALCLTVTLSFLSSCELPPRESWEIIQRDGLLTYWSREYNPPIAPSRYMVPSGSPLVPRRQQQVTQIPYRPKASENRYLANGSEPRRSRYRESEGRREESPRLRTAQTEVPKIDLDPVKTAPNPTPPAASLKPAMDSLPYGTPVAGRPGMVNSPFAQKQQLVDVTGMAAGEAVKDPYSGKLFRVPPTLPMQEAAAEKTEAEPAPVPEEKADTKP